MHSATESKPATKKFETGGGEHPTIMETNDDDDAASKESSGNTSGQRQGGLSIEDL